MVMRWGRVFVSNDLFSARGGERNPGPLRFAPTHPEGEHAFRKESVNVRAEAWLVVRIDLDDSCVLARRSHATLDGYPGNRLREPEPLAAKVAPERLEDNISETILRYRHAGPLGSDTKRSMRSSRFDGRREHPIGLAVA